MKTYVELGLAALLAVLVYEKPKFLTNATNTTLGKVVMIVTVGLLAKLYGINAGILAAIIMIALVFKVITADDIDYRDGRIHGINGIDFTKNQIFIERDI